MKWPYFFHTFLFCFILCMITAWESHMRPQQKYTLISKVAIPLILITLITLLWLSIALFWQHFFTEGAAEDQSTYKSLSLFCDFAFWLVRTVVHWPVNIWQNKLQAVWILDILWHALCSLADKVSILGGKKCHIHFSRINVELFFQMWFDSVFSFFLSFWSILQFFVALPCTPITPISIHIVLKVLELLPLESLSTILKYRFALSMSMATIVTSGMKNPPEKLEYSQVLPRFWL